MFITKVTRKDGQEETIQYSTSTEAYEHLLRYQNNISKQYSSISVLDTEKRKILLYMGFDIGGASLGIIRDGDLVVVRKELNNKNTRHNLYYVRDINEYNETGTIFSVYGSVPAGHMRTISLKEIEHVR